jgi:hypothetical protein
MKPAIQHRDVSFIIVKPQKRIHLLQRRFAVAPNHSKVAHIYEFLCEEQSDAFEQIRVGVNS